MRISRGAIGGVASSAIALAMTTASASASETPKGAAPAESVEPAAVPAELAGGHPAGGHQVPVAPKGAPWTGGGDLAAIVSSWER